MTSHLADLVRDSISTGLDANGEPVRTKRWESPLLVSLELRDQAKRAAAEIAAHEDRPSSRSDVARWIISLGNLVKVSAKVDREDAKLKVEAYADMLDHPAGVYTRDTLKAAAKRFVFFPAFAELDEFLGECADEIRTMRQRMEIIAAIEPPRSPLPEALERLGILDRSLIRAWFMNVAVKRKGEKGEFVIVVAQTRFARDWIAQRYEDHIRRALAAGDVAVIAEGDPEPEPKRLSAFAPLLAQIKADEPKRDAAAIVAGAIRRMETQETD